MLLAAPSAVTRTGTQPAPGCQGRDCKAKLARVHGPMPAPGAPARPRRQHAAATLATRTYAPGLATGLVLVLPAAVAVLSAGFSRHELQLGRFLLTAGIFIPAVLRSIPLLFWAGRRLAPILN